MRQLTHFKFAALAVSITELMAVFSVSLLVPFSLAQEVVTCTVGVALGVSYGENLEPHELVHYNCRPPGDPFVYKLPESITEEFSYDDFRSGTQMIEIVGAHLVSDSNGERIVLDVEDSEWFLLEDVEDRNLLVFDTTDRPRTTLGVYVTGTRGSNLPFSPSDLSARLFGNGFSAKGIYSDCSHGAVELIPATGQGITNGVFQLNVNEDFSRINDSDVLENTLTRAFLNTHFDSIRTWDHIVFCFPQTSFESRLWAYVNSFRSYFVGPYCNYPSALVHELGHNVGLQHSQEDSNRYGDETCLMGYSYGETDSPRKCFNGHKHWLLGWYDNRKITVNPSTTWRGIVYPFTATGSSQLALVNVDDLYIQYNRANSFNTDVTEYPDLVTVVKGEDSESISYLLASLSDGESFSYRGFVIEICSLNSQRVDMSIYLSGRPSGCQSTVGNAPPACRDKGLPCSFGTECCSGRCGGGSCRASTDEGVVVKNSLANGRGGGGGRARVRGGQ